MELFTLATQLRTRARSLLLVVPIALVALVAGGCGGEADTAKTVEAAFKHPVSRATVALDAQVKVTGSPQLSGPLRLRITGPFESGGDKRLPKVDWNVTASGQGQTFSGRLVSTADNAYISFAGSDYEVGREEIARANQQIARQRTQANGKAAARLDLDPRSWIVDGEDKGEEDVAGVKTTHVSGGIDVGKLFDDLLAAFEKASAGIGGGRSLSGLISDDQRRQFREKAKEVVNEASFDLFVGKDDGVIRRFTNRLGLQVPADQRGRAAGATGATVSFSIELSNVGAAQKFVAPKNPKPLSELTRSLGGLGGLGGLGALQGRGTPPGSQ